MPIRLRHNLGAAYSPLYFLAALGLGGLAVSFFMWLMFWVPHPGKPVPTFEDIAAVLQAGEPAPVAMVIGAMLGIAVFAVLHVRVLLWNLAEYAGFKRTPAYPALRDGNNETQLLAAPLTVAMAINVGFILGLVFVPGLWSVVEYLFPMAIVAFAAVGVWAVSIMADFWGRVLTRGGFDCTQNNSFAQLLPAFSLAMIGVGLAAPVAMSATPWIAAVGYGLSTLFIVAAVLIGTVKLVLGLRAMMEHGVNAESAPTLWIVVPILTVISIALMRQNHGLHVHFGGHAEAAETLRTLTTFLAAQLLFLGFGWIVLRRHGYFRRFVSGRELSPGAYALVCPGVALSVMLHFYLNKGLVGVGAVAPGDVAYWLISALAVAVQVITIRLVVTLNAKYLGRPATGGGEAEPGGERQPSA
ncbi:MAG: hypothetical protein KDA64_15425 [Rhodospirillaceae bacterium]|nr:hypothetical protein [Rhodospirillaceae bacterium]